MNSLNTISLLEILTNMPEEIKSFEYQRAAQWGKTLFIEYNNSMDAKTANNNIKKVFSTKLYLATETLTIFLNLRRYLESPAKYVYGKREY